MLLVGCDGDNTRAVQLAPCPTTMLSSAQCFVGESFAECPGTQAAPRAYCGMFGCRWVSTGCPLKEHPTPLASDCRCNGTYCPGELSPTMSSFYLAWGNKPWTRTRATNVRVTWNASTTSPPAISCSKCEGSCSAQYGLCAGAHVKVSRSALSTKTVRLLATGLLAGWYLSLELDFDATPPVARACRLQFTDVHDCSPPTEPVCASSGSIDLVPLAQPDAELHGTLSLVFPDAEMSGSF
ncbi:MAG: hypothetical protein KC503_37775 [Myxococcales bacterium]|nr:hypothetical protein [Myxococcales bacterium]